MMAALAGAGCISLLFFAGTLWPHPASLLLAGVIATLAGLTFARLQIAFWSAHVVSTQLRALGPTMLVQELVFHVAPLGPETKVFLATPALQPLIGSFRCQLGGERVLVLEAPSPAIPQPQTVLGGF